MKLNLQAAKALSTLLLLVTGTAAQEGAISPSHGRSTRGAAVASSASQGHHGSQIQYGIRQRSVRPSHYGPRPTRGYTHSPRHTQGSRRIWTDGFHDTVRRRIWVSAAYDRIWVAPVYSLSTNLFGISIKVLVHDGYWRSVHVPAHYEDRYERVWRPGRWRTVAYGH